MSYYYTINQTAETEFKDRGSRFIAYAFPIQSPEEFKTKLQELKKLHPKAVHHCFAYRIGTDGTVFRKSDDGEPSGSAGAPILNQIDSKQLTNIAVVVVRYFGGTLLGVPGLINAYKTVTSLVLQIIPSIKKQELTKIRLEFPHAQLNQVKYIIEQFEGEILEIKFELFCVLVVGIPKNLVSKYNEYYKGNNSTLFEILA